MPAPEGLVGGALAMPALIIPPELLLTNAADLRQEPAPALRQLDAEPHPP
jgi:hypothetical protein